MKRTNYAALFAALLLLCLAVLCGCKNETPNPAPATSDTSASELPVVTTESTTAQQAPSLTTEDPDGGLWSPTVE